ncbi:MAG: EpsI family protein [Sphingobium sp.]|nr:EpsI family protein [Sphingobium sp.]MCP5399026.1 EpsI family protein [Sphingomonas sp.]
MAPAIRLTPATLRGYAATPGWLRQLLGLTGLAVAILLIFWRDAADMIRIWWTSSTYGHCLFIPMLIGWLVHQRKDGLARLHPSAWPWALLWPAAGAFGWLLGDAAGLAVLRHGGLVVMLQGAVAAMLGPVVTRALLFPLFYAFFMVPVGSELEPALQLLTAKLSMIMLGWANVPAHIEGIFITIPNGYFEVAEACSGAKFLIAMTAYGVLVCNVCFRSWLRRTIFLTGALATCIVANGVRAFATIYVAHKTSVDAAVGFDHVMYGWLFFALVMIVVMLVAWPFFDRKPGDPVFDPAKLQSMTSSRHSLTGVLAIALAVIVAGPVWSHISVIRAETQLAPPALPSVSGWRLSDAPMAYPWAPRFDGADHKVQARYEDGQGHVVDLAIVSFARQSEGRELIGFGQGAADPDSEWVWSDHAASPDVARAEIITAPGPVERYVLSWYRVGDAGLTGAANRVKLDTMKARLLGRNQRAVAILVSIENPRLNGGKETVHAFLKSLDPIEDLADGATRSR